MFKTSAQIAYEVICKLAGDGEPMGNLVLDQTWPPQQSSNTYDPKLQNWNASRAQPQTMNRPAVAAPKTQGGLLAR